MAFPAMADQNALDRAQYMLRQINTQKVQLEQENSQLKAEIAELKKESDKQLKQQETGNKKLGQANKQKDELIQKLRDKVKETVIALRQSESERLQASKSGETLTTDLKTCAENNHKLVNLNAELVGKYGKKGVWDALVQAEPFTGIEQVAIENIIQEYRFRNEDLEVKAPKEFKPVGEPESRVPE
jgi:cell division septum initiation protein DivIVA